jgi:hypothetical protein
VFENFSRASDKIPRGEGKPSIDLSYVSNLSLFLTENSTRADYTEQSVIALQGNDWYLSLQTVKERFLM